MFFFKKQFKNLWKIILYQSICLNERNLKLPGLYGPFGDNAPATIIPKKRGRSLRKAQNKLMLNPKSGLSLTYQITPSTD